MKAPTRHRFLAVILLVLALHLGALVFILSAASPSAENNPAPTRAVSKTCARGGSPVCPAQRCAPAAAPFGVLSAPICNPAAAGSRVSRGPGAFSDFDPVKQYGAFVGAPTLPVAAG